MKLAFFATLLLVAPNMILAQDETAEDAKPQKQQAEVIAKAVDGEIRRGVNIVIPKGPDMSRMVAAKRFQLNQIFAVEIEEVTRVCELDEAQITKLTVGAKGAVKKLTVEWMKTAAVDLGMVELSDEVDPGGDEEAGREQTLAQEPEVEITDADQLDEDTIEMVVMGNSPFDPDLSVDHEFWQKTLASVLSETQSANLSHYRQERAVTKQKVQVAHCMDSLRRELGLTDEQQTRLALLVTPLIENADVKCHAFFEPYLAYYHVSKVDMESLKAILSPAQIQKFKLMMVPANEVGEMIAMEAQAFEVDEVQELEVESDDDG